MLFIKLDISQKKGKYVINSINPVYLIINKVDGFIEEKEGDKYLNFAFTDNNSEVLKKYTEISSGIKNEIKARNSDGSGEYGKYYMKIKFNSDEDLPLNKQSLLEVFLKKMVNTAAGLEPTTT